MNLKTCTLLLAGTLAAVLPAAAEKKIIVPAEMAPKAGAPAPVFSPGILVDGTLYVAGQLGADPKTRQIPESFEDEVQNALNNIEVVLKEAGMSFKDAVTVTIYLTDMDLFQRMNAVYLKTMPEPRPVRAAIGVAKLASPKGHIEISLTAHK